MRKLLFISPLFLGLFACGGNNSVEVGQKTTMEIDTLINAGTVVKGEVINARIKFKNTGEYPLVFGEVKPSCSCTVAEKPEEPITPGESGEIIAQVKTDHNPTSHIIKTVTVMTNTEPNLHVIYIKGKIK